MWFVIIMCMLWQVGYYIKVCNVLFGEVKIKLQLLLIGDQVVELVCWRNGYFIFPYISDGGWRKAETSGWFCLLWNVLIGYSKSIQFLKTQCFIYH